MNEHNFCVGENICIIAFSLLIGCWVVPHNMNNSARGVKWVVERQRDCTIVGMGARVPGGGSLLENIVSLKVRFYYACD